MDSIKVTCGLIHNDGKIFLCRRKPEKSLGGYWEFPGGKLEADESHEECLKRELQEELGMSVDVLEHFKTIVHDYETFSIELISFICDYKSSGIVMADHDAFEWVKLSDLLNWNLAPADVPIAMELSKLGGVTRGK